MKKVMKGANVNLNRNDVWVEHQNLVKKTARKFLGEKHRDWVDDITQDAMIKAILNQEKYDNQVANLGAWLYTLTKNLCLDFMRQKKNDIYNHIDISSANDLSINENNDLEVFEFENQINNALDKLTTREKSLLTLKYYEDNSSKEIAVALGLPEKNIPCYTMRARKQLKDVILKIAS